MKWLLFLLVLFSGCQTHPRKRNPPSFLTEAATARISSDFEANFVDRVARELSEVPRNEDQRSSSDSDFLRHLLKRNVVRGFECNERFNELLVDDYGVGLRFHELEYLEKSRISTCGSVAFESMKLDTVENQTHYHHLFLEQLVSEMNSIIKYSETERSPSGLKLKKLLKINLKTDDYFSERCLAGLKSHCQSKAEARQVFDSLEKALMSAKARSGSKKQHWLLPIMKEFFNSLKSIKT